VKSLPKFKHKDRVLFTDPESGETSEWFITTSDEDLEEVYQDEDYGHAIIDLENDSGSEQEVFLYELEPLSNTVKLIQED